MAVSSNKDISVKRYTLPRITFTFSGSFKSVGSVPSNILSRAVGVYISYLGDNTGPVSLCLGNDAVYALGTNGTTMTRLEATVVYI